MDPNDLSLSESNFTTPKLQKVSSIRSSRSNKSSCSGSKKTKSIAADEDGCSIRLPVGISSSIPNIHHARRKLSFSGLAELNGATGLALAHLFDEISQYKDRKLNEIPETSESVDDGRCGRSDCCDCYGCEDADGHDGECRGACSRRVSSVVEEEDDQDEDEQLFYTEDDLRRMFQERNIDVEPIAEYNGLGIIRERNLKPEHFYHPDYQQPK